MSEKTKSYLALVAILFVGVISYAVLSYVQTYSNSIQPGTYRSFSVSGEGKVVAVPNIALFTFSVITEGGKDLAALQKDNTGKTNKAIDFVKSKGVDAKDIKTDGYSVSPRYQYSNCGPVVYGGGSSRVCPPPEIAGYSINQTVSVKVRDFSKAGDILAGVVAAGANSVSQINFSIDDRTAVENQARAEAMVKAKTKAEAIAKAGGFRLGKLLSIDEGFSGGPIYMRADAGFGKGGAPEALPAPAIEPGSQDVVIDVTLRYEIR